MKSTVKITKNPFAWLAFAAVAINIYAHFTITSIPLVTYVLIGSIVFFALSRGMLYNSMNTKYFMYSAVLLIYVFAVSLVSPEGSANMTKMIIFQLLICMCLFMYILTSPKSIDTLIILMSLGVLIMCITILTDEELFNTLTAAARDDSTYYTLGDNNRNTIGIILGLGALYMLYLGFAKNKLWFIPMVVVIIIGLITGSRKVVIAVFCGILLFVFLYLKFFPRKGAFRKIAIALAVILLLGLMLYACFAVDVLYNIIGFRLEGLLETLTGRGEGEASAEIRYHMIEKAMEMFFQKPIFGWGIEGFAANSGFGVYSHNNFTETLVSFGIVGFVLLYSYKLVLVIAQLRSIAKEKDKHKSMQGIIIVVAMAIALVLDFAAISMNNLVLNIPFALSAAYLFIGKNEKRKQK